MDKLYFILFLSILFIFPAYADGNLTKWINDSSNIEVAWMDTYGNLLVNQLQIGEHSDIDKSNPSIIVKDLSLTLNTGDYSNLYSWVIKTDGNSDRSTYMYGMLTAMHLNDASEVHGDLSGMWVWTVLTHGDLGDAGGERNLIGIGSDLIMYGDTVNQHMTGARISTLLQTGEVEEDVYGVWSQVVIKPEATVGGTSFGFYMNDPESTVDYGYYQSGTADNYLSGNLGIGQLVPTEDLQVADNAYIEDDLMVGTKTPGTITLDGAGNLLVANDAEIGGLLKVDEINNTGFTYGENASFHNFSVRNDLFVGNDITAVGTITGEQITSTDDINAVDDIFAGDRLYVGNAEDHFFRVAGNSLEIRNIVGAVGGIIVRNSQSPILNLQNDVCSRNLAQLFAGQCERFSVAQSANINYTFFELATSGEVQQVRWYGYPVGFSKVYGGLSVSNDTGNPSITSSTGTIDMNDVFLTGKLNVSGNVTASNVFLPQYIFSHTNQTIPVLGANLWTNVTFSQEDSDIKVGITHIYNDATNDTFTILEDGVYNIDYDFDVEDTSAGASDIDVAGRLIYKNGSEVVGSVFEIDVTKQGTEVELSHNFLARLTASNELVFQFVATDADIQISTHGNFGEYPESATIVMNKIANI